MKKYLLILTILFIAFLTSCKKNIQDVTSSADIPSVEVAYNVSDQFVPNELIVKFKSGTSDKTRAQSLEFINGKVAEHIVTKAMQSAGDNDGIYLINTNTDVFSAIARMKAESNIEYAEPNYIYSHAATSNDTYYLSGYLWGMYGPATSPANQYGSRAATAWANGHTGSSSVVVGVIDEGAMYSHPDLSGNILNPGEYGKTAGVDDDLNGKVDDIYGWDFATGDNSTYDGTSDDHGTHVSGTIGALGGNGSGVAGVNWNVTMISAKFLGATGGTTANAVKAVDYITDLKVNHGLNVVATNNSWGGGGYSQALYDAIERANVQGILFIAAAGNGNQGGRAINIDSKPSYPASYNNANIIAVAAIDKTGRIASFSNYGALSVDLGAPGVSVLSTVPGGYSYYDGTSMATPHVTGAAALYAATNNLIPKTAADAAVIKKAILDAARATPTSSLSGKTVTGGRLNVSGF